jgi:hypothetical protein
MPCLTAAHFRRQTQRRDRWHDAVASALVLVVAVLVFWLVPAPDRTPARQRAHGEPGAERGAGAPPCRAFSRCPAMATPCPTSATAHHRPSGRCPDPAVQVLHPDITALRL